MATELVHACETVNIHVSCMAWARASGGAFQVQQSKHQSFKQPWATGLQPKQGCGKGFPTWGAWLQIASVQGQHAWTRWCVHLTTSKQRVLLSSASEKQNRTWGQQTTVPRKNIGQRHRALSLVHMQGKVASSQTGLTECALDTCWLYFWSFAEVGPKPLPENSWPPETPIV